MWLGAQIQNYYITPIFDGVGYINYVLLRQIYSKKKHMLWCLLSFKKSFLYFHRYLTIAICVCIVYSVCESVRVCFVILPKKKKKKDLCFMFSALLSRLKRVYNIDSYLNKKVLIEIIH